MIDFTLTSQQPFDILAAMQLAAQQNLSARLQMAQPQDINDPTVNTVAGARNGQERDV
jgi:hypothetical protein